MKKNCLEIVKSKCENCNACALGTTRTNLVFSDGNADSAKIVLIGEAPGEMEDLSGKPFVGRAGKLLDEFLAEAGLSREEDLYIMNTVKCRPPENRVPTDEEKTMCSKFLNAQIDIMNPKAIILCGATAMKSFIDDKKVAISKVRGQWMEIQVNGKEYKAMAIYHPSYLLRNHKVEEGSPRWLMSQDLREVKNSVMLERECAMV